MIEDLVHAGLVLLTVAVVAVSILAVRADIAACEESTCPTENKTPRYLVLDGCVCVEVPK